MLQTRSHVTGTTRRQHIATMIAAYTQAHNYPPTIREIGDSVGLSSSSTVQAHLDVMVREGVILRDSVKARSLRVVGEVDVPMVVEVGGDRVVGLNRPGYVKIRGGHYDRGMRFEVVNFETGQKWTQAVEVQG